MIFYRRASLVSAAAVIPASEMYTYFAEVKTFVVENSNIN